MAIIKHISVKNRFYSDAVESVDSFEQMVEFLKGIYGWKIRVTDKTVTFATADMKKGFEGISLVRDMEKLSL